MFSSFSPSPILAFLKRQRWQEYVAAKLVFLTLVLLIAAPNASAQDTLFTFDTEGPTACGTNENPVYTDSSSQDGVDVRSIRRGEALTCEDEADDAFGSSGFDSSFNTNQSVAFKLYTGEPLLGLLFDPDRKFSFDVWRAGNGPTEGRVLLTIDEDTTFVVGAFPITSTPTRQSFEWPPTGTGSCDPIAPGACLIDSARVSFQARFPNDGSEATAFAAPQEAMYVDNVAAGLVALIPVELTHFTATSTEERAATLRWQTASETGNDGFRVERRAPGTAKDMWQRVGFVESKAAGGTSQQTLSYQFRAEDLQPGTHAFRLRQKDIDGNTEVHGPVRVEVGLGARFLLKAPYPNPAQAGEAATVRFASRQGERVRVALYDARGRRVRALYRGAPPAGQLESVRVGGLEDLASGTYFVRLTAGDGSVTKTQALTLVR